MLCRLDPEDSCRLDMWRFCTLSPLSCPGANCPPPERQRFESVGGGAGCGVGVGVVAGAVVVVVFQWVTFLLAWSRLRGRDS
eukprot:7592882-Ditylum_brightwellii.AAC.1